MFDAASRGQLPKVRSAGLAEWVVAHYPRRPYPVVFVGSSNGAMLHLAAALGAAWLPQTLLLAVRHGNLDPDDPETDMRQMGSAARQFLDRNPDLALNHMHDPSQDRLMISGMSYFRTKWLRLPAAYRSFLRDCMAPDGTIVLVDCELKWPVTTVGPRHVFQFGGCGGASADEYRLGSNRVRDFLHEQDSSTPNWRPPAADATGPEAEWGFLEDLTADVMHLAAHLPAQLQRLSFTHPEDLSPVIAKTFRAWYEDLGLPTDRLLASSFLLLDPVLTMRTGQVPYWSLFGTQPSRDRLVDYLQQGTPYDDIRLAIFPHGVRSVALGGIEDWEAPLRLARRCGEFLAVSPSHYPRHFRALPGFHRELSRLPAPYRPPKLKWVRARQYLQAGAGEAVQLTEEQPH